MNASEIPAELFALLERPLFGVLSVIGRGGRVLSSPMWYEVVDGTIRFSHTNAREKYRALQQNPAMTLVVIDPDDPQQYVEVRGELVEAIPDPTGAFHLHLARRYGESEPHVPGDPAVRVILVMSMDRVRGH